MKEQGWKYAACGLDDVYLLSGYHVEGEGPRGPIVRIQDIDGLHRAIGEDLVRQKRSLNGKELRFLRNELGLSQTNLADLLGESEQTVARREKAKRRPKTPTPQERMIRYLYEQHIGGDEKMKEFLHDLATLDEKREEECWNWGNNGWHKRAA
jgi:putative transcriptional regulator